VGILVYEGKTHNIFGIASRKPTKDKEADEFLEYIWHRFKTLPFALRWMIEKYEEKKARQLIELLIKKRNVHAYPVLIEGNRKIVAQAEHTLIPTETFINVITL
jgi:methionyl aminopeptidase